MVEVSICQLVSGTVPRQRARQVQKKEKWMKQVKSRFTNNTITLEEYVNTMSTYETRSRKRGPFPQEFIRGYGCYIVGPKVSSSKISAKYIQTVPIVLPRSCVNTIAIHPLQWLLRVDKDGHHCQPPSYGVLTGQHCTRVSTSGSIRKLLVLAYRNEINISRNRGKHLYDT